MPVGVKLTYPHLALPDSQEYTAYVAIVQTLKQDSILSRIVRTWVTWDGDIQDETDPAVAFCPYIRVSPFPNESFWITEGQHKGDIVLRLNCAIVGTRWKEIANFFGAVRSAIFQPQGSAGWTTVTGNLTAAGILRPTIMLSAYGVTDKGDDGVRMLIADGTIKFGLLIKT